MAIFYFTKRFFKTKLAVLFGVALLLVGGASAGYYGYKAFAENTAAIEKTATVVAITADEETAMAVDDREPEPEPVVETPQVSEVQVVYTQTQTQTPAPAPIDAGLPTWINIPAIGVNTSVITVGLTAGGAVDTPANLWQAAWFNGSARPNSGGAVFIDGHSPGVFQNLGSLGVGSIISLSLADGSVINYQVVANEYTPLSDVKMWRVLSKAYGGSEGLNIMTCAGTYVPSLGTYDHRTTVFAVKI